MLFLAPMASITDLPYRLLFRKHLGVDGVVSELISSHGIFYKDRKTLKMCEYHPDERPVYGQIFGYDIPKLVFAAKFLQDMGYDGVDLNLGCPVQKVVQKGGGAGMLRDIPALLATLESIKKAISIPFSIKIRLGWDSDGINAHQVVGFAKELGIERVSIHGRTRQQGYKGQANWELMREVAYAFPNFVIGNGDLRSLEMVRECKRDAPFLGIMIGRAALSYPWIFQEVRLGKKLHILPEQIMELLRTYLEYVCIYFPQNSHYIQLRFKKMASWLSYGLPYASKFRAEIFKLQCENQQSMIQYAEEFFGACGQDEFSNRELEAIYHGGEG